MIYNTIFSERFKNINFLPEKELFLQKGSKLVTLLNLLSLYDSYGPLAMILGCWKSQFWPKSSYVLGNLKSNFLIKW